MGGKTTHVEKCPICKKPVKELIFDKRDLNLKCITCYGEKK